MTGDASLNPTSTFPVAGHCSAMQFNHNGSVVAVATTAGIEIRVRGRGKEAPTILTSRGAANLARGSKFVALSSGSRYLLSGGSDNIIQLYDLKQPRPSRFCIALFQIESSALILILAYCFAIP